MGIDVTFVDMSRLDNIKKALRETTRVSHKN
jgi:O-acetylhomoserine/O-acetylserine sulfhydrylase-like pyridoxal-dependent enzyme